MVKFEVMFQPAVFNQHRVGPVAQDGRVGPDFAKPPRVLAYTFGKASESEVTFELTPQGKNVLLVLTHRSRGGDIADMADFASGWHTHVSHLVALLEGAPRPPFWSMFRKVWEPYEKARLAAAAKPQPKTGVNREKKKTS